MDEYAHRGHCSIVGIGSTDFSQASGRTPQMLAAQAVSSALTDAGIDPSEVDAVIRCDMDSVLPNDLAATLGMSRLSYWSSMGSGGVAPSAMITNAVSIIMAGLADTVVIVRALNGRSGARYGVGTANMAPVGGQGSYDELTQPYGLIAPGQFFALLADRHRSQYGTTAEHLGAIAIACRRAANRNPRAQMVERSLDLETYLESRIISSPLRLFDYCLETDGACAAVVTSTERARDLAQPPAVVQAVAMDSGPSEHFGSMMAHLLRTDMLDLPSRYTAESLYRRAGLGPNDVDVAQIYDCFTITALLQLESFGFCAAGEGGAFAASGALLRGGKLPINTGGGHLSEGYIHGMNHITEGVRQIRGTSTSQAEGAEVCLVTSAPLGASATILTVDRR